MEQRIWDNPERKMCKLIKDYETKKSTTLTSHGNI